MVICVYGCEEDRNLIVDCISQMPENSADELHCDIYSDYDDFIFVASKKKYDIIFVTADNADGMEAVIAAKSIFRSIPVIWLSNDIGFGAQSYRLCVNYFHTKPITANVLEKAMQKCLIKSSI